MNRAAGFKPGGRCAERGSALLVVLVVLAIVTMYAVSNSVVLSNLRMELRLIETQQKKRVQNAAGTESAARPRTSTE